MNLLVEMLLVFFMVLAYKPHNFVQTFDDFRNGLFLLCLQLQSFAVLANLKVELLEIFGDSLLNLGEMVAGD